MVGHIKNLLENQGINCIIRNEHISNLPGVMPINEILPEIWIGEDSRFKEAKKIIEDALYSKEQPTGLGSWECPTCKETMEPQFSECWSCGKSKPGNKNT